MRKHPTWQCSTGIIIRTVRRSDSCVNGACSRGRQAHYFAAFEKGEVVSGLQVVQARRDLWFRIDGTANLRLKAVMSGSEVPWPLWPNLQLFASRTNHEPVFPGPGCAGHEHADPPATVAVSRGAYLCHSHPHLLQHTDIHRRSHTTGCRLRPRPSAYCFQLLF